MIYLPQYRVGNEMRVSDFLWHFSLECLYLIPSLSLSAFTPFTYFIVTLLCSCIVFWCYCIFEHSLAQEHFFGINKLQSYLIFSVCVYVCVWLYLLYIWPRAQRPCLKHKRNVLTNTGSYTETPSVRQCLCWAWNQYPSQRGEII